MNRGPFPAELLRVAVAFAVGAASAEIATVQAAALDPSSLEKPNVLLVIADQWRAQAFGFAGDPNARTPHLDRLARQSCNFVNAIAGLPVCCPTRASLLTGRRPLTTGVFLNDVPLAP